MRLKKQLFQAATQWLFSLGAVVTTLGSMTGSAQAHHPFGRYYGGYSSCFGNYGHYSYGGYAHCLPALAYRPRCFGGFYDSYYSGFYGSGHYGFGSSAFYSAAPFCYTPRLYSVNYYSPAYTVIPYTPAFYSSRYTAPVQNITPAWGHASYPSNASFASAKILEGNPFSLNVAPAQATFPRAVSSRELTPIDAPKSSSAPTDTSSAAEEREPGLVLVSDKPAMLQPYSPIWTKAAVGLVDEMIAAGEFANAKVSCKSMERIKQPKGSGVYLRQALTTYFAEESSTQSTTNDEQVLNLLEMACSHGSQLEPTELTKKSLHEYFESCLIDVDGSLEQLSKSILDSSSNTGSQLLLLTALLKLDGQQDRAVLFANEAKLQLSGPDGLRWSNLLNICSLK